MIAQVCDLEVGELYYTLHDVHIYMNHLEGAKEVIRRSKEEQMFNLPKLNLNEEVKNIDDFTLEDIKVLDYQSHPSIKLPLAV